MGRMGLALLASRGFGCISHVNFCVPPPGAITTLGRGGSDLTATVLGAALELEEVQVWKDVDGEQEAMLLPAHQLLS